MPCLKMEFLRTEGIGYGGYEIGVEGAGDGVVVGLVVECSLYTRASHMR